MSEKAIDWLELVTGFDCNCRCRVCPSTTLPGGVALSRDEMELWLTQGKEMGARKVWFGGGEPCLHPGLARAISFAKDLAYQRIRVQSNGLRFAYPAFTDKLVQDGLDEVSLSIKGFDPRSHDGLTRVPGSFDFLVRSVRVLAEAGVSVLGDVLVTSDSMDHLLEIIDKFSALGVEEFTFWLMSLHGLEADSHSALLPKMSDAGSRIADGLSRLDSLGLKATTLHTPPCVLPPKQRNKYFHAGQYNLLVVVPGQDPFMAEESPMEGGFFLASCQDCCCRSSCLGLREDYLKVHGSAGIDPILA